MPDMLLIMHIVPSYAVHMYHPTEPEDYIQGVVSVILPYRVAGRLFRAFRRRRGHPAFSAGLCLRIIQRRPSYEATYLQHLSWDPLHVAKRPHTPRR